MQPRRSCLQTESCKFTKVRTLYLLAMPPAEGLVYTKPSDLRVYTKPSDATVSALRQATSKGPSWPRFRCPSTHFLSPRPWGVHIMFKTFAVNAPSPHNFTTTTDHKLLSLSNNSVNLQFKLRESQRRPIIESHHALQATGPQDRH